MHCANDLDDGLSNIFANLPLSGFARAPEICLKLPRDGSSFTPALKDGDEPGCGAHKLDVSRMSKGHDFCMMRATRVTVARLVHTGGGGSSKKMRCDTIKRTYEGDAWNHREPHGLPYLCHSG